MRPTLRAVLIAALAAGVGCEVDGTVNPKGFDDYTCDDDARWIDLLTPGSPVDYLELRSVTEGWDFGEEAPTQSVSTLASRGEACSGATDVEACQAELDAWPGEPDPNTGCGREEWGDCVYTRLIYTRGDEVGMLTSVEEMAALLGPIDVAAEAVFLARRSGYGVDCEGSVQAQGDGSWHVIGDKQVSDCPITDEVHRVAISGVGEVSVDEVLKSEESDVCVGRRPDGLQPCQPDEADPVARHLAQVAMLEQAAVVAFERLAVQLEALGAPDTLVTRCRDAARDEVEHAAMMGEVARSHGAVPPPIRVEPDRTRTALDLALENAVEGCVRETWGVVDALHRSQAAPTERLRTLFARIGRDEARHAELSWDLAAWLHTRLSDAERAQVANARDKAFEDLISELRAGARSRTDAAQRALGAPSAQASVRMVEQLRVSLAA